MAKLQKTRQPGDQIRINLSGTVADEVVASALELGISYSAYVQLRLQGQLNKETSSVYVRPDQSQRVHSSAHWPLTVVPNPPQTTTTPDEPKQTIRSLSELPSV